jgi:F420-dependent oxidoreductase-like protein
VKVSFKTAPMHTDWPSIRDVWVEADDLDVFVGGWTFDHFTPLRGDESGPCLEGWMLLASLASITSRVRLGVMVTGNTYRHPAVLANMAATVDVVSDGRLDLGIGAGWFASEHEAYGIELPPLRERFDRFDEAVEVIHLLLTQDVSDFDGRHYRLRGARCEPKPVQQPRPPFVIGGGGERRTLRTTARWADHWNFPSMGFDLDAFRHKLAVLEEWCERIGRPSSEIEKSIQFGVGDPAALPDRLAQAAAAGADHAVVGLPTPHRVADLMALAEAVRATQ